MFCVSEIALKMQKTEENKLRKKELEILRDYDIK